MDIRWNESENKGKAYIELNGETKAEMTFSKAGTQLLIIDHTEVDESLKGQGIGRKLLDKVVEKARERNLKILPLCPYAKSVFQKDESIADVLK